MFTKKIYILIRNTQITMKFFIEHNENIIKAIKYGQLTAN